MATLPSPPPGDQTAEEASGEFRGTKRITVPVAAARLVMGRYSHTRNQEVGEGDIHASYSADTIAAASRVRKAFRWQAQLMVTVSLRGRGGSEEAEAYQIIPIRAFTGTPTSYGEKIGTAEGAHAARSDPNGFYHGMTVTQGAETLVMVGPPVTFVAAEGPARPEEATGGEPEQLSLF